MTSDGFKKIFIGLIFIFLDIVIFINWLPDFIRYILILQGCVMLSSKEKLFKNTVNTLKILTGISIIKLLISILTNFTMVCYLTLFAIEHIMTPLLYNIDFAGVIRTIAIFVVGAQVVCNILILVIINRSKKLLEDKSDLV